MRGWEHETTVSVPGGSAGALGGSGGPCGRERMLPPAQAETPKRFVVVYEQDSPPVKLIKDTETGKCWIQVFNGDVPITSVKCGQAGR